MKVHAASTARALTLLAASVLLPWQAAVADDDRDLVRGEATYNYWCLPCHDDGSQYPGTASLRIKYDGNLPALLTEREDLTPDVIRLFVREGVLSMPPFRKTEITDEELDALAAYLAPR